MIKDENDIETPDKRFDQQLEMIFCVMRHLVEMRTRKGPPQGWNLHKDRGLMEVPRPAYRRGRSQAVSDRIYHG